MEYEYEKWAKTGTGKYLISLQEGTVLTCNVIFKYISNNPTLQKPL